jgi:hypothetical protein
MPKQKYKLPLLPKCLSDIVYGYLDYNGCPLCGDNLLLMGDHVETKSCVEIQLVVPLQYISHDNDSVTFSDHSSLFSGNCIISQQLNGDVEFSY